MNTFWDVRWMRIALINFVIAALAGLLLRLVFVAEVPGISYKNVLQAHSHIALLGWVYLAYMVLIRKYFVPTECQVKRKYHLSFLSLEIIVIGMFICFMIYGYAPISIAFLGLHAVITLYLIYILTKDSKKFGKFFPLNSRKWILASLFFLAFSLLGPMTLGPIAAMGLRGSSIYYIAIQFFLHFQFSGWLTFAFFAILLRVIELRGISIDKKILNRFYIYLMASSFLTFALGVAWSTPLAVVFFINSVAVILQLIAAWYFWQLIKFSGSEVISLFPGYSGTLLKFAVGCFMAKIMIQTLVVIPYIATISFTLRWYVIGFIHLILLGFVSLGIFALAFQAGQLKWKTPIAHLGLKVYIIAFLVTEFLLFLQGTMLWMSLGFFKYFFEALLITSLGLPVSLAFILFGQKKSVETEENIQ